MQYAKPVTLNVEECDRLSFLPYLFGNDFLYAEAYVYALAQKMMPEYQGGFWHFIRLPDGGGYMMPDGDRFHLVNGENWFDRTVSADAAGIILTSLVINRQLWLYHDSGNAGLTHLYLRKGAQVYIEGQLRTRSWEDNGITRYVTEILVKTTGTMQMLGRAAGTQTQPEEAQQFSGQPQPESQPEPKKGGAKTKGRGRKAAQPEPQQPSEPAYDFDDDIPF